MRKMLSAVLAVFFSCLFFSGCSLDVLDAKNLMAPPKVNADQQAIYGLLQGDRPDIVFTYPKTGEYRSAIIMHDFTGDGVSDAIGFCSLEEPGGVEVQFLEKAGDEWRTAASFQNTAIQVDRVVFSDLTGSGVDDVLIGWGSTAGTTGRTASVNAYSYDGMGGVTEYPLGVYAEMALTDFDGDSVNEVFTVDKYLPAEEEGDTSSPARVRVYAWKDGVMQETCSADADNSISSYSAVAFGQISSTLHGVVLDGAKADGSLTTQIFYLQDGVLVNVPAGVNTETYTNPYFRPSAASFLCRDINGDGTLEIPVVTQLPGIPPETAPDPTCYLVKWSVYRQNNIPRTALFALMNPAENYWFQLPASLAGQITATNDTERRAVTYTEVTPPEEDGSQLLEAPLFSIRAFTRSSWETRGQSGGYEQLAAQNDTVYGIQVLTQDEAMLKNIERIKENFKLLSD